MGSLSRVRTLALVALMALPAIPLPAAAQDADAQPAPERSWSPYEPFGVPAGAGITHGDKLVVATGSVSAYAGGPGDACLAEQGADAPEIYLFNTTADGGCNNALSPDPGFQRAITALDTAPRGNLAVVGVEPFDQPAVRPDVYAFRVGDDGNLTPAWSDNVRGAVVALDVAYVGTRAAVLSDDAGNMRVTVLAGSGERTFGVGAPAGATHVAVSPNGRYIAVTAPGTDGARLQVYDASATSPASPRTDTTVASEGSVSALQIGDDAGVLIGTSNGELVQRPLNGALVRVSLGGNPVVLPDQPLAEPIVAASGRNLHAVGTDADGLASIWNRTLPSAANDIAVADRMVVALSSRLNAFTLDGTSRWSTPGSGLLATSPDGSIVAHVGARAASGPTDANRVLVHVRAMHTVLALEAASGTIELAPGASGRTNLTISNAGSAVADVDLRVDGPPGTTFVVEPDRLSIAPGTSGTAVLTVAVSASAAAGEHVIDLAATDDRSGTSASTPLELSITPTPVLAVRLATDQEAVVGTTPGGTADVDFVLSNGGNTDLNATLAIGQAVNMGPDWDVSVVGQTRVNIQPGSLTPITLRVTAPDGAANGTLARVLLNARAGDVQASRTVDVIVNPFEALEITERQSRVLAPGEAATATFTVENTGTVASNVSIQVFQDVDGAPQLPVDVSVQFPRDARRLDPGEEWPVRVEASTSPRATGTVVLTVRAVTDDGERADGSFEITINPDAADGAAEPPRRDEPLPAVLVPIALVAAGAVAARRRRRDRR